MRKAGPLIMFILSNFSERSNTRKSILNNRGLGVSYTNANSSELSQDDRGYLAIRFRDSSFDF